ncbi:hypothetical protein F5I97DRAFT_2064169 [Phlebopus sp. FC_14]|nr:hypothetical protein F5I97DRAFT_2064169 [Phlebopus sp. FC_14]
MATVTISEPFAPPQSRGALAGAIFALLSTLAFAFIAFRSIRLVVIPYFRGDNSTYRAPENLFFRIRLGHYAASLVLSNLFISLAGLIGFSWFSHSGIIQGSLCSAQAVLMQIGVWTTCYFTVAIGLHTCNSLVFRVRQVRWLGSAVNAVGWITAFIAALAPLHHSNAYGPNGISCGIAPQYRTEIFLLEAFPIILGAVQSIVVFSVNYLVLHGGFSVGRGLKFTFKAQERWSALHDFEEYHRFIGAIAQSMFWYPFVIVVFLMPLCVANLVLYTASTVPDALDIFARLSSFMLGVVNVGLLYNTFRVISPVFRGPPSVKLDLDAEKTWGNSAFDESPVLPPQPAYMPQGPVHPVDEKNGRAHGIQRLSRTPSGSSAESTTQLLSVKRKSSKYNKMRVRQMNPLPALPKHNIVPPAELNRQMDAEASTLLRKNSKDHGLRIDLPAASDGQVLSPPLLTVSLSPPPPQPSAGGSKPPRGTPNSRRPLSRGGRRVTRQITEAFGKRPSFKSKVPPALNLAPHPVTPNLLSTREVTNKSATLAARLGLPSAQPPLSAEMPLLTSPLPKRDKGKGKAPPPPATPVPRIGVMSPAMSSAPSPRPLPQLPNSFPESNERENVRSSVSSFGSVDSESNYSPEASHGSLMDEISSFPNIVRADDSEEGSIDAEFSTGPTVKRRQTFQSRRTTAASVWSQESAYTASQPPDIEAALAYQKLMPNANMLGVAQGDQAGASQTVGRPAGPRVARSKYGRPAKSPSKFTIRFAHALKSPKSPGFTMVLAPNDSVV